MSERQSGSGARRARAGGAGSRQASATPPPGRCGAPFGPVCAPMGSALLTAYVARLHGAPRALPHRRTDRLTHDNTSEKISISPRSYSSFRSSIASRFWYSYAAAAPAPPRAAPAHPLAVSSRRSFPASHARDSASDVSPLRDARTHEHDRRRHRSAVDGSGATTQRSRRSVVRRRHGSRCRVGSRSTRDASRRRSAYGVTMACKQRTSDSGR